MGLNFQTCTLINSNLDPDSGEGVVLFEKKDNGDVRIKRDFHFVKDNIINVRMRKGYNATACKATIDFGAFLSKFKKADVDVMYGRLDIYLEYEGAEYFYGANPTQIRKGIPFWIEFAVNADDTADVVAKAVADTIKKDHLFLVDKDVIKVEVSGGKITLTGTQEHARFKNIEVRKFSLTEEYPVKVAALDTAAVKLNERGKNSFGTYSQIVKDLRLPTAANYQWTHIRQVETPIVGAIYDQFIIDYAAPAVNDGLQAVGERMVSNTQHVFWVKNDIAASFEALFDEVVDVDASEPEPEGNELDN